MNLMRALATHLFLPNQSNNQRPRILHPQALALYLTVFFVLQMGFRVGKFVYPEILGIATNITAERLLSLTNQKRQENSLPPLNLDLALSAAAFKKAQDMFSKKYWAHVAPDGKSPWQFLEESGYSYLFAGENLAKDFADSEGVVSAWMASPTHKDNILKKEYEDIGFAVLNGRLNGEETTLVVQMFGKRKVALAPKPPLIPAKAAMAEVPETAVPSSQPLPTPFVTPTPALEVPLVVPLHYLTAGVTKKPLIDILSLERQISLGLLTMLVLVLAIDGVIVFRKKTIRAVGHNIAHIIFLMVLLVLIFLTRRGVIL